MAKQTGMLIKPTIHECMGKAVSLGMPESEGRKFFHYYQSQGWKVGKNPMINFNSAMAGWLERWLAGGDKDRPKEMSGADKMIARDEYDRVIARMKTLENSYDSHVEMRAKDRTEYFELRKRRDTLRKQLGIMI